MMLRPAALLLAGAVLLSACEQNAPVQETGADAERNAKGEVIGGTISDDMIPLDRLRSQSPAMREEPAAASGDGGADEGASPQSEPEAGPVGDDGEADEAPAGN